jgi:hypothetical protein
MAGPAAREPATLVTRVRSRTVENVDSTGVVIGCSTNCHHSPANPSVDVTEIPQPILDLPQLRGLELLGLLPPGRRRSVLAGSFAGSSFRPTAD